MSEPSSSGIMGISPTGAARFDEKKVFENGVSELLKPIFNLVMQKASNNIQQQRQENYIICVKTSKLKMQYIFGNSF